MSAAERFDDGLEGQEDTTGSVLSATPDAVEVRRNGGLAALVGALASAVAIAYLARAASTGATLDWVLAGALGLVAVVHLHAFVDARTPLLVADPQGVRLRLGRAWRGLPWGALAAVEHTPRRGLLHDGRLVLVPHNTARVLDELDAAGRRQSALSRRLYGAPFAVPLGLSTRVPGTGEDLTTALRQLAGGSARVVELIDDGQASGTDPVVETEPEPRPRLRLDPRPPLAALISRLATPFVRRADAGDEQAVEEETVEPTARASETPAPLRLPRLGRRAEVTATIGTTSGAADAEDKGRQLRRPGSVDLVEETQQWGDRVRPLARLGEPVEPLRIDGFEVEPASDPVIGPEIAAARTRIGITVDRLAERTRIRPHVIESIEVDDFAPCGGDFYARGHLRTLARVLGLDAAPLLTSYDERYADAPVNPRRVFEAELASGASGGIHSTRGGPNWSALVAVVMALVLAWSVARLVMDTPPEIQTPAPLLNGSGGPAGAAPGAGNVTLKVSAEGTSHLVVRNARDRVVFDAQVEYGEVHRLDVTPPVTVKADDAGVILVEVDGKKRGTLGQDGKAAEKTFRAD